MSDKIVENSVVKRAGQSIEGVILYSKSPVCDKGEQGKTEIKHKPTRVSSVIVKKGASSPKALRSEPKERRFSYVSVTLYKKSVPIDKMSITVTKPLTEFSFDGIRDKKESIALTKEITKGFYRTMDKSFMLAHPKAPIVIKSSSTLTEITFNPKYHSLPLIKFLIAMIFGIDAEATLTKLHVSVDINMFFVDVKERLRIGHKRNVELYSSGVYMEKVDPVTKIRYFRSKCTEYIGKKNRVVVYDSGKHHGFGEKNSRVEVQINERKRLNYIQLKDIEDLKNLEPFKHINLPISFRTLSPKNQAYVDSLYSYGVMRGIPLKQAMAEIRKDDKSKADSISRALRLRDGLLFDFQNAYLVNLRSFLNSKLTHDDLRFISCLTCSIAETGYGTKTKAI